MLKIGVAILSLLVALMASPSGMADMKVKEEATTRAGSASGTATSRNEYVVVYYVQGSARRRDTWSVLGTHSAVVRHCDTGKAYAIEFDRKQYWELRPLIYRSRPTPKPSGTEGAGASGRTTNATLVTIRSRTVEVGKPRRVFGHLARHYVTNAEEFVGPPAATPEAEQHIDGWYLSGIREPNTNCLPDDLAAQPSAWIGAPDLAPIGNIAPPWQHSGPSATGLAVEETRTIDFKKASTRSGVKGTTMSLYHKVVDLSESPLDPSLFLVPKGFTRVAEPPFGKPVTR
ncbi:MAG TPA: hypothetical protein VKU44_07900 [Terriglobia bacterium]|nr:hypothetical protein [Terriglobia bacterium]